MWWAFEINFPNLEYLDEADNMDYYDTLRCLTTTRSLNSGFNVSSLFKTQSHNKIGKVSDIASLYKKAPSPSLPKNNHTRKLKANGGDH